MNFITTAWEPLETVDGIKPPSAPPQKLTGGVGTLEPRHWLFLIGVGWVASSPIVVLFAREWAVGLLLASFGMLMISIAAILVPNSTQKG